MTLDRGQACAACSFQSAPGAQFCMRCGAALGAPAGYTCPSCGTRSAERTAFCVTCGARSSDGPAPSAAAAPTPAPWQASAPAATPWQANAPAAPAATPWQANAAPAVPAAAPWQANAAPAAAAASPSQANGGPAAPWQTNAAPAAPAAAPWQANAAPAAAPGPANSGPSGWQGIAAPVTPQGGSGAFPAPQSWSSWSQPAAAPAPSQWGSSGSGSFFVPKGMPEVAGAPPAPRAAAPAPVVTPSRPAFCVGCGETALPGKALCAACDESQHVCGSCNTVWERARNVCDCRSMLALPRDFVLDPNEYEYSGDRQALNALRALKPVNMIADHIAKKLGKPFIEGQFIGSGIRVSHDQFPHINRLAEQADSVLCMPTLPQIYIAGDKFWNAETYGTATDSFIVLGSSLARSLSEAELLFVIAKELGHAKSGHAMYRTVAQIVGGSHSNNPMAGGLLGFLDIRRLVSLPIELPLMSWLRQSEITADCAGLAVVGDLEIARKALILMSLRAPDLYKQINFDAWLKQQEELDGKVSSLNEFISQNTPFVARRVRFLTEYGATPTFTQMRQRMASSKDLEPVLKAIENYKEGATSAAGAATSTPPKEPVSDADTIRGRCPKCQGTYSVPRAKLPEQGKVHLKCKGCGSTFPVTR